MADHNKESIVVAVAERGRRREVREYGRIANTAALDRLLHKLGGGAGPATVVVPSPIPNRAGD